MGSGFCGRSSAKPLQIVTNGALLLLRPIVLKAGAMAMMPTAMRTRNEGMRVKIALSYVQQELCSIVSTCEQWCRALDIIGAFVHFK